MKSFEDAAKEITESALRGNANFALTPSPLKNGKFILSTGAKTVVKVEHGRAFIISVGVDEAHIRRLREECDEALTEIERGRS